MKRLIVAAVVLLMAANANAQKISHLRGHLNVREVGSAARVVASYDAQQAAATVEGYRVRIFFDSKQTARANSLQVQSQFDALYPNIPSYWTFESPNFVVTVGNFVSREEAFSLVGRIAGAFPKAFVVRMSIPVAAFATKE